MHSLDHFHLFLQRGKILAWNIYGEADLLFNYNPCSGEGNSAEEVCNFDRVTNVIGWLCIALNPIISWGQRRIAFEYYR